MPKVFRIGYIELETTNLLQQSEYYENVLGLRRTETAADAAYLSLGLDHHNVTLRLGRASGLSRIGFQVNRDINLRDLARDFQNAGLSVSHKSDARPGVADLIEVTLPGSIPVQLFHTMTMPAPGFSERGIVPVRLGHVALLATEADKVIKFYADLLGFHITDWFENFATFLTCNPDHHALNVIQSHRSQVHHVAFQLRDRSHHCDAADFLARSRIATIWGPARHTAGHNFAAYHRDADGTIIELYTDMDVLLPELGLFEPRPWHEDRPQKPKVWSTGTFTTWNTHYEFNFEVE